VFNRNYIPLLFGSLLSLAPISVFSYDLDSLYESKHKLNSINYFQQNGLFKKSLFSEDLEELNITSENFYYLNNSSFISSNRSSKENNKQQSIYNPNLLDIKGPSLTLIFSQVSAKTILQEIAKLGGYDFVWVNNEPTSQSKRTEQVISSLDQESNEFQSLNLESQQGSELSELESTSESSQQNADSPRLLTISLKDINYSKGLNAVLLASGLQAKMQEGILYVGPDVRNTIFSERKSVIYYLNQITASSAADYLANLGASVTKTYTINTSVTEGATQSDSVQGGASSSTTTEQAETSVKVYGATIGPLLGLVATTDERLQTITLVGEPILVELAESFLKDLDKRQQQVALSVQIIDVSVTNDNSFGNDFAFRTNNTFILNENGILKTVLGPGFPSGLPVGDLLKNDDGVVLSPALRLSKSFISSLQLQLEQGTATVLANPTLILSEYTGPAGDGEIGREFGNDGYVEVGDKVPVNATPEEGSSICTVEYGLVGIKLGARILGIDNNDYVTFTISPEITGISDSVKIVGCPNINLLSTRKVDTGSIRVKNNDTLILTGVLQDTDVEKLFKTPLLGDLPILGRLFKKRTVSKEKRELVILVTPNIIKEAS